MNESQRQLFNLGRFVLAFAQVEAYLRITLTELGGISDTFSRIVLGGVRAEDAISHVKKLLKVKNVDSGMALGYAEVFEHFAPIKDARNLILHSGIAWCGTGFATTNRSRTLNPKDEIIIPVSSEIFEQMIDDLDKMTAMLVNHLLQLDGTSPSALAFDPAARRPWRYERPQQSGQTEKKGQKGQQQDKSR